MFIQIPAHTFQTFIAIGFAACVLLCSCRTTTGNIPLFKEQPFIDTLLAQHAYDSVIKISNAALRRYDDSGSLPARVFLYHTLSRSYKNSSFDSAVHYAEKAYNLVRQGADSVGMARQAAWLFSLYNRVRNIGKQKDMLSYIRQHAENDELPVMLRAEMLYELGDYYKHNNTGGNRDLTIFYSMQALEQNKKHLEMRAPSTADSIRIELCLLHLVSGYTHYDFSEINPQSAQYLEEARIWVPEDRYAKAYFYSTLVLWHCFYETDMDKAKQYADSVKYIAEAPGENVWDFLSESYLLLADHYYYKTQDHIAAWQYAELAKEIQSKGLSRYYAVCINWLVADLYLKDHNYKKSLKYYRLAWQQRDYLSHTNHFFLEIANIRSFANLGMIDSFNHYFDKYESYLEQFRKYEEEDKVEQFNVLNQGRMRKLKIKEQSLALEYEHKRMFTLVFILGLVVVIALLLYINYKQKNKAAAQLDIQNKQLLSLNKDLNEANDTKSKLFGIISHDLRSPVAELYQLLRLQHAKSIVISEAEKATLEEQTRQATAHLLHGMEELLLWSKSQLQAFNINMEMEDLNGLLRSGLQLFSLQIQSKSLNIANNISKGSAVYTDANILSTILRNLIQNAIKASPDKGIITIDYFTDPVDASKSFLTIANEGKAFTQEDYIHALSSSRTSGLLSGGLGFQIVDELSRKINVHVFFEDAGAGKTCCNLVFNQH